MAVATQKLLFLLNKIPWSSTNWDVFLVIFLVGGSILYSLFLGKRRVMVILTAIYMTLAVLAYTPFIGKISEVLGSASKTAIFIIGFVVLFFMVSRGALHRAFSRGGYVGSWWQALLLAFLQLGLLLSIFLSFLPANYQEHFSSLTRAVLLGDWGRLTWLVLPILVMAAMGEKGKNDF